jgi:hypothetical protein
VTETGAFHFHTERRLVALTGIRAATLAQLLKGLREVPGSSIFYHTHHMYLAHHFETPVFFNDFAMWVSNALQEQRLGERLAAIDLLSFQSIRELREAIIGVIEEDLGADGRRMRECAPGDEFHFQRSKSFIIQTGLVAHDPAEFFELLPKVTKTSLYFHFFESRLRLERVGNDFSQWLRWRGKEELAAKIEALDPYAVSLDEFRDKIIALGRRN